ncbi:AAA ATPase midasin, partial [Coemansia sp. RSA 2708]
VYMDELQRDDLQIICAELFPAHDGIDAVLEFNWQMHQATMGRREFGAMGAPWEFNLRDVSRFMELALTPSALERAPKPVDEFIPMLYEQRMRTPADRLRVRDLFASVFGRALAPHTPSLHVTEAFLQVGNAVLPRRPADARLTRLRALATQLPCLESLMKCIEMRWMAILVGSAGAGKTSLVRWLAAATGNRLVEFSMNSGVDTSEILGGFEQVDMQRHRSLLLRSAQALVDRILVSCDFGSPEWSELAAHACALLQQARRSDDKHVLHEQMSQLVTIAQPVSSVDGIAELTAEVQRAADAFVELEAAGRFEWVDGVLVDALERGAWLLLDRANLCSASVLDRLNGLLEPNGVLYVNEDPKRTGPVVPHPDFRIIMAVDPQHGELSRAMRNRGIEICMLPAEPECILDDQMTVARALGVSGELLAGVQRPEGSMNELVQSAVHVAERVERGYPAWVESTADSAGEPPSLQPRALNATVAVASWQAQLAALSLQSAPQDVDASTWRQRMLLAALSTVPPDAQALDTRVLAAIVSDRLIGQVLAPEQPLALELVQARKLLADESQVSATLLPSAPTYVQLNLGLFRALERQADRPVARWHQALQATRLFQMERMLAESNSVTGADGNLRELVLQRPNVDVVHVQSLFALLDGCDQLLDDWEQQVAAAKVFDSDMVP